MTQNDIGRSSARASMRMRTALAALMGVQFAACPRDDAPPPKDPATDPTVTVPEVEPTPEPTAMPEDDSHDPTAVADAGTEPVAAGDGWTNGSLYCAHAPGTPPTAQGCAPSMSAVRAIEPAPNGMHGFSFDLGGTKNQRKSHPDACCFRVIRPMRGRPLRVAQRERTAPVLASRAWLAEMALEVDGVPERERAAAIWADDAALEHASVAEFSRLSLALMALGAPPELLVGAQQAALDEIEHARIAYGIASQLAGRALGPGAIDVEDVAVASSLVELVRDSVMDGCIGECIGALEIAVASETTHQPSLADALAVMAEDESRHAALAYSIVVWAIGRASTDELVAIRAILDEATRALKGSLHPVPRARFDDNGKAPLGRLSATERERVRCDGVRLAVLPAIAALRARAA